MLVEDLKEFIKGEVEDDDGILRKCSRDASLFEVKPEVVVFPKDASDVKKLVGFVSSEKDHSPGISLTARSGGTDMTGGPLSESIIVDFSRHLNRVGEVGEGFAVTEPGVFYRDFEEGTLRQGYILPSYPASREICTVGGMVANNSGGEKTLKYGKTEGYVKKLKVVFSDGQEYLVRPLSKRELDKKLSQDNFEGRVYRNIYRLVEGNREVLEGARPRVSKNSAGYCLWDVWDGEVFDLTRLLVGSQGTLGLVTEITFELVKVRPYEGMLVVFLEDLYSLADIVHAVLPYRQTSFESFDDNPMRLALKFFPGFLKLMGAKNLFSLAWSFLPEFLMVALRGVPRLVLLTEFEERSQEEVDRKLGELKRALRKFGVRTRVVRSSRGMRKYWTIRRESFNLLRSKVKDRQAAPFVDDVIVRPERLPEFLPKLCEILDKHNLLYTIAGHVGDGNFHIIPLMDLSQERSREKIPVVTKEVYDLVLKYRGSITAEHNDGLIRSPYLKKMYGKEVYGLFEEVKRIFDPKGIFNPGKKIGADLGYAMGHIRRG